VSSDASKSGVVRWFTLAMATAGGAGFAPVAPGTFGSAVGVALFAGLVSLGIGMLGLALAIAVVFAVGCWASGEAERRFGKQDDGRIVIDEVAGQLLTLAPLLALPSAMGPARSALWLLGGFALFRLFDIWKPGPVRWAERRFSGGLGVMADDMVAGGLGALALTGALALGASRT
jgi:phosphatidylglycerophosphatase A